MNKQLLKEFLFKLLHPKVYKNFIEMWQVACDEHHYPLGIWMSMNRKINDFYKLRKEIKNCGACGYCKIKNE